MLLTGRKGSVLRGSRVKSGYGDQEGPRDLFGERQGLGMQWVGEGWDRGEPELVHAQPRDNCVDLAPLTGHHRNMSGWVRSDAFLQQRFW